MAHGTINPQVMQQISSYNRQLDEATIDRINDYFLLSDDDTDQLMQFSGFLL